MSWTKQWPNCLSNPMLTNKATDGGRNIQWILNSSITSIIYILCIIDTPFFLLILSFPIRVGKGLLRLMTALYLNGLWSAAVSSAYLPRDIISLLKPILSYSFPKLNFPAKKHWKSLLQSYKRHKKRVCYTTLVVHKNIIIWRVCSRYSIQSSQNIVRWVRCLGVWINSDVQDHLYRRFDKLRKISLAASKPVVASMADVAASGGYYMAMAAGAIVSENLTLTGSIGVVTGKPQLLL